MKKILIVFDVHGWVFERHAKEIKQRLSHKYVIDICSIYEDIEMLSRGYDCVYVMDPMPLHTYPPQEKTIMGLRCQWLYENNPFGAKGLYDSSIKDKCRIMHVVNRNQFAEFSFINKPLFLTPHGVNVKIFNKRAKTSGGVLMVGCNGRRDSLGQKGFEIVEQACKESGFAFLRMAEFKNAWDHSDMVHFYEDLDVFVSMSASEGHNNSILEAGAAACAVVATNVGSVPEIIVNEVNGLVIDRSKEALKLALEKCRLPAFRDGIGENLRKTIEINWDWNKCIMHYENMFDFFFQLD